ncbi:MAG TPA: hypothetical protein VJR27_01000 [Candidatus Saccharimonadales bacterium]|nr:hypothetical protein [Candidatus Saccharimonadales bacterium]
MDSNKADKSLDGPVVADSLETPETVVEPTPPSIGSEPSPAAGSSQAKPNAAGTPLPGSNSSAPPPANKPEPPKHGIKQKIHALSERFNIYLLLFILLLIITAIAITVTTLQLRKTSNNNAKIGNQSLSDSALQQLANSDATVGTSNQTLNVQSNAVFAGQVLVRSNMEVAGTIKVGGAASVSSLTVGGTSTLSQVQAAGLSVSGNAAVQGNLTTQGNLNVSGTGSFGSVSAQRLSVGSLQLNGSLVLTSHITAGGPIPRKSDGNALGGGGTSSLSGSDTAGTININTGSSPAAGCFVNVTFAQAFSGTPRVLLTPVSSAAAGLPYYVTRSGTSFSVCTAAPAAAGQNISFDYAIFD